jgi:hypothetical protein
MAKENVDAHGQKPPISTISVLNLAWRLKAPNLKPSDIAGLQITWKSYLCKLDAQVE